MQMNRFCGLLFNGNKQQIKPLGVRGGKWYKRDREKTWKMEREGEIYGLGLGVEGA